MHNARNMNSGKPVVFMPASVASSGPAQGGKRLRPMLLLALLLLPLLQSFSLPARAADPVARIVSYTGKVEIRRAGGATWEASRFGVELYAGDFIRTGADAKVAVLLSDESQMQLNRNSLLELKEVAQSSTWQRLRGYVRTGLENLKSSYTLQSGEIWLRNKNRDASIDINTTVVSASIRGTELTVRIDEQEQATVTVLEGEILASNSLGNLTATAGEEVSASRGTAPVKRLLVQPEDAVQWVLNIPALFGAEAFRETSMPLPPGAADYINRIAALGEQQQISEARSVLGEALQSHPDNTILQTQSAWLDLLEGRPRDSQSALQAVLAREESLAPAWNLLALVSVMLNDKEAAAEAAGHAVQLAPESATAHLIQSYTLQAAFDLDAALGSVERALVLEPDNVTALVDLARLQFGRDRLEEAEAAIERAYAIAPGNGEVLQMRGFIRLAGNATAEAEQDFRAAQAADTAAAEPWLGLSLALMRQGSVADALEAITTAVLLDPQRSLFLSYWAKMLYQVRRFDKALDVLDRARKLDPRDPTTELYQAIILRDLNRPGEAIRALNRAIALNDNRGVYRSRLLLDQDLAVKNVDLSLLYSQLGLNAWAGRKAINAIKQDYTNHAGHLFYAGSLLQQEGRDYAFSAEALLARLLQPANANTFNSFNNYTSFFEQPDLNANLAATIGTQTTRNGELILNGFLPQADLAWQGGVFYESTDGWRDTNFVKLRSFAGIAKWQATPKDGVMLAASRTRNRQGDENFPRYEYDTPANPTERENAEVTRLELGYHHRFSPETDLLVYLARLDTDLFLRDRVELAAPFVVPTPIPIIVVPPLTGDLVQEVDFENPYYQVQGQLMHRWRQHQLIAGTVQYWGDREALNLRTLNVYSDGEAFISPALGLPYIASSRHDRGTRFQSYYLQDIWQMTPSLILEAALYYDLMDNANVIDGTAWSLTEVDPRIGLIWSPTAQDTVRLAAFRYLLPFISARTDPTDIAGIPIIRNTEEGALNTELDIAWEHEWESGMFTANIFSLDRRLESRSVINMAVTPLVEEGDFDGIEIRVNQLLTDSLGLEAGYHHYAIEDESQPDADRSEDGVSLSLSYVRSNGFSARVRQGWRRLDLDNRPSNESIPLTDLELGYQFPGKWGSVRLEARNLFNERFNWVTDRFTLQGRNPEREVFGTVSLNY